MAITRRQFVTRVGAIAAAAGLSQSEVARIAEALAFSSTGTDLGGTLGKPRVVWIHGAECTGCSTSLLGLFKDLGGEAVPGTGITVGAAAGLAKVLPTELAGSNLTYPALGFGPDPAGSLDIVDLVVDVVDLQYHETVMGMGGDTAAQWLTGFVPALGGTTGTAPFVLVVEGALQDRLQGGAWNDVSNTGVSWCSIARPNNPAGAELDMPEIVVSLAGDANCVAVIPIGQCATFGGYPGAKPAISDVAAAKYLDGFDPRKSQTGAMGTYDYLVAHGATGAANKVINVPGCPTNPWWFALTVVMFLVDLNNASRPLGVLTAGGAINVDAVDSTRRLKAVYGNPIHGPYCPRYRYYTQGIFATVPGEQGCLQKIGCKGPATNSLCGLHGWNAQQPQDGTTAAVRTGEYNLYNTNTSPSGVATGGHCTCAGHPCMACTEKGYPDSFVPFVVRS
jgi:hydrogenase small subunit